MTATEQYHVGILVYDLDAAVEHFSEALGLSFQDPMVVHIDFAEGPEPRSFEARVTYSIEGPPHLELMEATDEGFLARSRPEGLHHIGVWAGDTEALRQRLSGTLRTMARGVTPDGRTRAWFNNPADLHGTIIEFYDEAHRPGIEAWLQSGGKQAHPFAVKDPSDDEAG